MVAASPANSKSVLRIPAHGRLTAEAAGAFRDLIEQQPSTGAWTTDLEQAVARLCDTPPPHVVAADSENAALSLVLRSLRLQPDDEVIMPAYAPDSIAEVICATECRPVPVDVQPDSLHIDPSLLADAVTSRTRAVVAVGVGGADVNADAVFDRVDSSTITLIESTCGLPSKPHAPDNGHVRCFTTPVPGGNSLSSGALICMADESLAARVRDRVQGVQPSGEAPLTLHMAQGMSELAAAWRLAQLDTVRPDWLRRCEMAMNYSAALSSRLVLEEPCEPVDSRIGWLDYVLRLKLQHLGVSRDELAARLQRRGVPAAARWLPVHFSPIFQQRYGFVPESFPVARNEFLRELGLPIHASLADDEIDYVIETLGDELDAIESRTAMAASRLRS
jgi:dTDP-4-amino-4,6-dideoxygalactose transaminase